MIILPGHIRPPENMGLTGSTLHSRLITHPGNQVIRRDFIAHRPAHPAIKRWDRYNIFRRGATRFYRDCCCDS